jgi:cell division protein FtsW
LEEKRKRDEALQQLIDAQVAINEEYPSEENQQKLDELKYSIREELKDTEGDSLINGQNPMNSVRNKE